MDNLDHSFLTLNRTSLSEHRSTKIIFTKKLFIRYSPYGMVQKFVLLKFSNWRAAWFFLLDVTPNVRIEQFDSSQWTPRKLSSCQKNSPSEKVHVELFLETRSMLVTDVGDEKWGIFCWYWSKFIRESRTRVRSDSHWSVDLWSGLLFFLFYFTNYILHVFYMSRHSFRHFFIAVVQYVKSISIGVVLV